MESNRKIAAISIPLLILIVYVWNSSADEQSGSQRQLHASSSGENYESAEELQEFEMDELIKNLEASINAQEATSEELIKEENQRDSRGMAQQRKPSSGDKTGVFEGPTGSGTIIPNPRDRKSINARRTGRDQQADISAVIDDLEARARIHKKKTHDNYEDVDELIKEAYGLASERSSDSWLHRNQLSDYEKDDQYRRSLLHLLNLYRLSGKRDRADNEREEDDDEEKETEEEEEEEEEKKKKERRQQEKKSLSDDRSMRHRSERRLSKNLRFVDSGKSRHLDRSRLLADHIAESALLLGQKKGRILEHLIDDTAKRDVEIAASTAAASSTAVDVGVGVSSAGAAVSTGGAVNVAGTASTATGGVAVDAALGVSGGLRVEGATGLSAGLGARTNLGLSLLGQLGSCQDYERKMIMDMAIQEASAMIRRLAYETRSEIGYKSDPEFERRILGLAIELVNRVTLGLAGGEVGSKFDLLGNYRYNGVDDYLKSSVLDAELQAGLVTNAGFDYLRHRDLLEGRRLYDDLDLYDEYLDHLGPYARDRCDSCSKYDMRMGNVCPVCKRSGTEPTGPKLQSRPKRESGLYADDWGKIYHLQKFQQNKRHKSGGVWEDVNKLYNFNDFENTRFINLSMNCSGTSEFANPDCQRLQLKLVTPKDADPVPLWTVRDYLSQGRDLGADMHERGRELQIAEGLRPSVHTASMLHFMNGRTTGTTVRLNEESQIMLYGTKVLQEKLRTEYNVKPRAFLDFLQHHGFRVTGNETCHSRQKRCNSLAKFRSIEGSCNNFINPSWGQSNTAFVRLLPARYSDGIHALPLGSSGGPLPNPRTLSARLFPRRNATDSLFTLALMQWGQIIAHDFARQTIDQTVEGGVECCTDTGKRPLPKTLQHHSCLPIVIPTDDDLYARYGQTCMNFVRSMTVVREDCSLGPANQLNGVSSFLDLSPVYGADRATSDTLREFRGGRMRIEIRSDRVMMPTLSRSGYCDARTNSDICFETGDVRTNQNPQLIVLQTLFIREHNRIAYELEALNPHWRDERLFQEARRILIAEYQHITYSHWLPLVIGKKYCRENIFPLNGGLSRDYDVTINPGTINGFTSGAFRFLHSMIEGNIYLMPDKYSIFSTIRLSDFYFRPQIVETNGNFEALLRGLIYQTIQKPDANFHEEVTEYLFRSGNNFGMDLEALDIQRGRDHGIPGYNAYRELCHLDRAEDFKGLINEIPFNNIQQLQSIYEHVDDIDLLVGATMETRMPGSLLGPTLQCLIGEQFYRSRVGDKYFYNNANFHHSFTHEQFSEIQKASLATMICELGEALYAVQENPFKVISRKNPRISCFDLPTINLEYWKEED